MRRPVIRSRREAVLTKAHGIAFDIFDERIAGVARQFEDFRKAEAAGAVLAADDDRRAGGPVSASAR